MIKHLRTIVVAVMLAQLACVAALLLSGKVDVETNHKYRWYGLVDNSRTLGKSRQAVAVFSDRRGSYSIGYWSHLDSFGYPCAISVDGKGIWLQRGAKRIKDVRVTGLRWDGK